MVLWRRRNACVGPASVRLAGVSPNERPTQMAHREVEAVLRPGDLAIDATAGNGHDTVFLAERVGDTGKVLAFDVQAEAIAAARARVADLAGRVDFIHGSHVELSEHAAPGSVAAVMFNLGYLPGADHSLITKVAETIPALLAASSLLSAGGLITIVCYPGHPGGEEEMRAVIEWASNLDSGWQVAKYEKLGTLKLSPVLLGIQKSGGGV